MEQTMEITKTNNMEHLTEDEFYVIYHTRKCTILFSEGVNISKEYHLDCCLYFTEDGNFIIEKNFKKRSCWFYEKSEYITCKTINDIVDIIDNKRLSNKAIKSINLQEIIDFSKYLLSI